MLATFKALVRQIFIRECGSVPFLGMAKEIYSIMYLQDNGQSSYKVCRP